MQNAEFRRFKGDLRAHNSHTKAKVPPPILPRPA